MNAQKIYVFLKYLFDERYLKEAVRDEWLKIYDKEVSLHRTHHPARTHGCTARSLWIRLARPYMHLGKRVARISLWEGARAFEAENRRMAVGRGAAVPVMQHALALA